MAAIWDHVSMPVGKNTERRHQSGIDGLMTPGVVIAFGGWKRAEWSPSWRHCYGWKLIQQCAREMVALVAQMPVGRQ